MKEIRTATIEARQDGEPMQLYGVPIVYDQKTLIHDEAGDYYEVIARGALANTDLSDTTLIYNHDTNKVPLARTPKTLTLARTLKGLEMRALLADTPQALEVWTAVQRGDLSGMSFAFTVEEGGSTYDPDTNTRVISAIRKIYEISVTPWPAYPQTSIEARAQMRETDGRRKAMLALNAAQAHKLNF